MKTTTKEKCKCHCHCECGGYHQKNNSLFQQWECEHCQPQVAGDWSEESWDEKLIKKIDIGHSDNCRAETGYEDDCNCYIRKIQDLLLQQQQRTIEEIEKINGTVTPGDKKYWNERFGGETANFIENAYISGVETVKLILRSKLSLKQGKEGNE